MGKGIKDVFYETRVLMGRDYTLRRFAAEVLGGVVDPVMLGYIEKGTRFPSEELVRRIAAVRKQDPHELLALLARDRILYAFARELRRVLRAPRALGGIHDAELAVLISQAIAALPDDGSWIPLARWRSLFRAGPTRRGRKTQVSESQLKQIEHVLRDRELIEVRASKVRRRGRHFVAKDEKERWSLALEFCALFAKGLLDKVVLPDKETGTYLRNHYLNIEADDLPEFQRRLNEAVRKLAEEFAADASATSRFLNVLITATPI